MKTGKKRARNVLISDFHAGYSEQFQKKRVLFGKKRSSKIILASLVAIFSFVIGYSAGRIFAPVSTTSAISPEEVMVGETSTKPENSIKNTKSSIEKVQEETIKTEAYIKRPSYSLEIPSIGLYTNIIPTYVNENNDIIVPGNGVGALTSYKGRYFNLLVGHRATAFKNLGEISYGDTINYYGTTYQVVSIYQQAIADVDMYNLTLNSAQLKLITCAGSNNSERLIVVANPI